jgi:hypothetical protein
MSLFQEITKIYADLTDFDFHPKTGSILVEDDGDGIAYIAKWDYSQPIPKGMKIGK